MAARPRRPDDSALIHVAVLGAPRVIRDGPEPLHSVTAQPRRFALLAYLLARGGSGGIGSVRRDTLLSVFWPESSESHARGALRSALHFLREELGPDAIVARGSDELLVSPERVGCDVVEFEALLARGDREGALALYRGDFLEGFHASDAPDFERWVDEERARLRGMARAAAWRLADEAAAGGHDGLAAHLARRAMALSGDDEASLRRLVERLALAGDGGLAYLGDGMVSLLGTNLDGAGGLSAVDARALLAETAALGPVSLAPATAGSIARRLGAGLFVLGDVVERAGRVRVTATVYGGDGRSGLRPETHRVDGDAREALGLVDDLSRRIAGSSVADAFARSAIRGSPSVDAWKAFLTGERDFRLGRYGAAVLSFQEAVQADSTFALGHYRLSTSAWWDGRRGLPGRAAEAALRHTGTLSQPDSLALAAWREQLAGDPAFAAGVPAAIGVVESAAAHSHDLAATSRLLRRLVAAGVSLDGPLFPQLRLVEVEMGRGRYRAALAALEAAPLVPSARKRELRAVAATLPFLPDGVPIAGEEREALLVVEATPLPPPSEPVWWGSSERPPVLWDGTWDLRRYYLLGLLAVRSGAALPEPPRAADPLRAWANEEEAAVRRFRAVVRARLLMDRGDPEGALALLGPREELVVRAYETLVDCQRPYERFLRGEIFEALGRPREALRWYATFADHKGHDVAYLAPAHLRRARIHDALGETEEAARHYARFARIWMEADPELQPLVREAEARRQALAR